MTIFKDNAPLYAGTGFRVAPVSPEQKHPCIADWQHGATNNPETVQRWVDQFPNHNIGAVTGEYQDGVLIVLDMDVKRPPINGIDTLQRWEILNGPLPKTLTAFTPSGGKHLFYKAHRTGLKHHSPTKGPASGVDVQADGAFVMLPPSTVGGKTYRFLNPDCPVAVATDAVYRFIDYVVSIDGSNSTRPTVTAPDPAENAIMQHELKPVLDALYTIPCERLSYEDWIHIGSALYNSGATVDVWAEWSQTDPDRYIEGECERKWATFAASRLNWNAGTIFKLAKKYGYRGSNGSTDDNSPRLVCAKDIQYEPPRWCLSPYFQRGKGTLIQGDNGSGKTAFMMGIIANVTTGRPLLGMPVATPGDALILSVEDDLPVLRGRLEANGADLSRCHFMANAAGLTFNDPSIEAAVQATGARLVLFDPFQAFLGAKVDMSQSNETRPELAKLFAMCDRNDCACVIIAHMAKGKMDRTPVNRALGSVDIPAAMRSILELTDNPNHPGEKVMVHVKCSNAPKGPSIAYSIGDRGGVNWVGTSPITADDLTTMNRRKEKGIPYETDPMVSVFKKLVELRPSGGFWSYNDVKAEGAKLLGHPPFDSVGDLRKRLDNGLARELQMRENIIVLHGQVARGNVRGLTIEAGTARS